MKPEIKKRLGIKSKLNPSPLDRRAIDDAAHTLTHALFSAYVHSLKP